MNGWLGPPWVRAGWFHATLLLGDAVNDQTKHDRIEADLQRLKARTYEDAVERINLERDVVTLLASSCRKIVVGYTVKREYFSAEYSAGIENIGFDSIEGLNSPIFIRTVKLKDFPWNGWLSLGADARPTAAWNPIAGFSDGFGRLMWSALSDPALLPSPNDAGWMLNRISERPGESWPMSWRLGDPMSPIISALSRCVLLTCLVSAAIVAVTGAKAAEVTFVIRIENGRVPETMRLIRVKQGDAVRLRLSSDRRMARQRYRG